MLEIPEEFDSLDAAAEYVARIHYTLRAMVETGRRAERPTTGTELAGVLLAQSALGKARCDAIKESAQKEVARKNAEDWAKLLD
jgi:hypothetical protein